MRVCRFAKAINHHALVAVYDLDTRQEVNRQRQEQQKYFKSHIHDVFGIVSSLYPVASKPNNRQFRRDCFPCIHALAKILAMKTNAVRIIDSLGFKYELKEYEVDPEDLTAETVASKIGFPLEQVFKTLVARGDKNGVCLAVVAGDAQLDLKALAKLSGDRKTEVVSLKEVQPLTGYVRGGVTALACKKDYPVFVDENVYLFDVISVSAGVRGTQIIINPEDYIKATKATVGQIAKA